MSDVMRQLPQYQCHKKVWALKIKQILSDDTGHALVPEGDFMPIVVDHKWMAKHNPQAGGYWVQYEDGYTSYSPAEAFESSYTYTPEDPKNVVLRDVFKQLGVILKHLGVVLVAKYTGFRI